MYTTCIFRNGNSQAIRIPADLAYERTDIKLEIERLGDEIRIRPAYWQSLENSHLISWLQDEMIMSRLKGKNCNVV